MTEPGPTADAVVAAMTAPPVTAAPVADPPGRPSRHQGLEAAAARSALAALVAGGALAAGTARAVDLLVVVAVIQGTFIIAWVQGAAVAVLPGESFDGPEGEVQLGPPPALLSSAPVDPPRTADERGPVLVASAMPGRIGALLIGGGAAAAADFAVSRWPHSALSPMLGILGLAVPVMFAHQLVRGVVRARVVESLSGITLVVVAVVALPSLVQLRHEIGGGHMAAATALASAVAVGVGQLVDLAWSRPRFDPDVPRGLAGVVVATAVGAAIGAYLLRHLTQFSTLQTIAYGAAIAAASALVAVATSLVAYSAPLTATLARGPRLLRPIALALLPIMLVAPGAYVLLLSA